MDDVEVTIYSQLPDGEPQGKFHVVVAENSQIGVLIRKVCLDNAIPLKNTYMLRNKNGKDLSWSSNVREHIQSSGKEFFLWNVAEEVKTKRNLKDCSIWWTFGVISLLVGAVGLITVAIVFAHNVKKDYEYGVVMDAGSSHTTLYVYKWSGEKYEDTALATQTDSCKVQGPGISSYDHDPQALAAPLKVCLEQAKESVPSDKHAATPIYLGATAGMRLLHEVNKNQTDAIFSVVHATIQKYPFKFSNATQQARIISGAEEGLYSWVTSNYITGKFGVNKPILQGVGNSWQLYATGDGTVGAMDLGGASTQMTFYPGNVVIQPGYEKDLQLYGMNYSVYTHSYLCYGVNEITRKYRALLIKSQNYNETVNNPCGPSGKTVAVPYTEVFEAPCTNDHGNPGIDKNTTFQLVGGSDNENCHSTVQQLFNFNATCPHPPCTFNGTHQPNVYGKYYAFSNFYYEMDFLNLTTATTTVTELSNFTAALLSLCDKPWSEVKDMKSSVKQFLPEYCFRGHYILTLLNEAYKFSDVDGSWQNINFVNDLKGTQIGWSLGYMISQSVHLPAVPLEEMMSLVTFVLLVVLFCIFVCMAVGFVLHAIKSMKQDSRRKYNLSVFGGTPSYGSV